MNLKWEDNSLIKNYCLGFSKLNIWKIRKLGYAKEDLFQECFIVYERCIRKFKGGDNALFFSLFKKSLNNMMYTLQKKALIEMGLFPVSVRDFEKDFNDERSVNLEKEVYFVLTMGEAPQEIKNYIKKYSSENVKKVGILGRKVKEYIRSASL